MNGCIQPVTEKEVSKKIPQQAEASDETESALPSRYVEILLKLEDKYLPGVEMKMFHLCWEVVRKELPPELAKVEYFMFIKERRTLWDETHIITIFMRKETASYLHDAGVLDTSVYPYHYKFKYDPRSGKIRYLRTTF